MSDNPENTTHPERLEQLSRARLGEDNELIQLQSHTDDGLALAYLCGQARHRINVYCHTMTPLIYDTRELIDALQAFALSSPRAELRILVEDTPALGKQCIRLLALRHRLSSRIDIRKTHHEFTDRLDEFVTLDGSAYFHRHNAEHYAASCSFHDPGTTKELDSFFDAAWEHSKPDPELRNMVM